MLSPRRLFWIGLVAFSFLMLLMPLLPTGYSSYVPNQCETFTVTTTGTPEVVTTITTTGPQASTETSTVSTTTSTVSTGCTGEIETVTLQVTVLLAIVITVPVVIAEYPVGLPLLVIFMVIAYGLIKRRIRNSKNI